MRRPVMTLFIVLLLIVSAALLYGRRLEYAPPHLEVDEVLIALDAQAMASTARDVHGELLPLYFPVGATSWYQPVVIYFMALVLKFAPLSESAIRFPTVCIAVVDVVLMYFVARQLFASDLFGFFAAALLALTPAHFIHGRYGMDYLYPVPFVLGWLLCLVLYLARRRAWLLILGMSVLGVGFYSYIASIVMMPLYCLFTCLVLYQEQARRRTYALAAAGFLPWLLPFLAWLVRHPRAFDATITKYALYDVHQLNAIQGARSLISYASASDHVSRYWNFFNPAFLLFGSGIKMLFSTNLVGVFLFPFAVLLPVGIYYALTRRTSPIHLVACLGFAAAPLAAAIVAEQNAIFRGLTILPFGVLLATMGLHYLWFAPIVKPLRWLYMTLSLAAAGTGAAYAAWTLLTQSRVTASSLPLILAGAGIFLAGSATRPPQAVANRRRLSAGAFDHSIRVLLIGLFWRLPNAIGRLVGGEHPRGARRDHRSRAARECSLCIPEPAGNHRAGGPKDDVHGRLLAVLSDKASSNRPSQSHPTVRARPRRSDSGGQLDPGKRGG